MMFGGERGNNLEHKFHNEPSLSTRLLNDVPPELELSYYQQAPSLGSESPSGFLNGESLKAEPISDLDLFFERLYSYYCEKGLKCIIIKWIVELLTLAFIISFSGFFLLFVDWNGLRKAKCGMDAVESGIKPCDLAKEALHRHPLTPLTLIKVIILGYLGITSIYWIFCFLRFFAQLKDTLEIRKFYINSLNVNDDEIQAMAWPSILEKVVKVQESQKLCIVKDLSAHDIVMRMMRKENYLIGMLNKGVLAFPISQWVPGTGPTSKKGLNVHGEDAVGRDSVNISNSIHAYLCRPKRADDILQFIADFTVNVEGVGHICRFSLFDFRNHGNSKYASPHNISRDYRSSQGKMEKSFLSFQSSYPSWEPNIDGKQFLSTLEKLRDQRIPDRIQKWTSNVQTQDYRWLVDLDHDHKHYPYILDWYYTSHHHHHHHPHDIEMGAMDVEDDQTRGDFEATNSTSRTIVQHHDLKNSGQTRWSHWWVRGGLPGARTADHQGLLTSFLQPPNFHQNDYNYDHYHDDFSDKSSLEHGQESGWRTMEDEDFNLPFDDIYDTHSQIPRRTDF